MCISNLFPLHWCTLSFHAQNAKWFVNDSNRTTKWEKFKTWLSPPRCCSRPKEPSTRLYNDIIKIIEIKTSRSIICNEDATAEDLRGRHRFGRTENTIRQRFSDLRRSGCIVDLSPPGYSLAGWWPVQKRASAMVLQQFCADATLQFSRLAQTAPNWNRLSSKSPSDGSRRFLRNIFEILHKLPAYR